MLPVNTLKRLPGLKQIHQSGLLRFGLTRHVGPYRGHFETFDEAQESLPASRRSTYDNDELALTGTERFSKIYNFDWPVLFYLQRMIAENNLSVVTDFGGHVGVKFYAYRATINFPEHLKWQVVEVPAMARQGRLRTPPSVTSLCFFETLQETTPCDLAIFSGALQFVDKPVDELIASMPAKPRVIILNKVPLASRGCGFVTLENFGRVSLASRIFSADELERARVALGYELASSWSISDRDFVVLSSHGGELAEMVGQAWVLRTPIGHNPS